MSLFFINCFTKIVNSNIIINNYDWSVKHYEIRN